MRYLALILSCLIMSNGVLGTAQIPDLLIYENDTLALYSNPLESYFNNGNPRPKYISASQCWSTACWRGYQAIWEVKDNKLYLNSITDCCFWKNYLITTNTLTELSGLIPQEVIEKLEQLKDKEYVSYDFREKLKKAIGKRMYKKYKDNILKASKQPKQKNDLSKLFPGKVVDNKVFAFWFSGDLTIPKGKMIEYVHMGYMSRYERELILSFENGDLMDAIEYDNKSRKIDEGYGVLKATSYTLVVPLDLIDNEEGYEYTMSDTIEYSNNAASKSLLALSKFNNSRKERKDRILLVENTIDSLSNKYSNTYNFNDKKTVKLRWGTGCWIDGQSKSDNESIRIFTMSNLNSQVIIEYKEKNIKPDRFVNIADYITYSVRLMEFGY